MKEENDYSRVGLKKEQTQLTEWSKENPLYKMDNVVNTTNSMSVARHTRFQVLHAQEKSPH